MPHNDITARLRMYKDLGRRTTAGNWVYTISWPVIFLGTDLHQHFPWQVWLLELLFVTVALLRLYHTRLAERWLPEREALWLALLYPVSLISITVWGTLTSIVLLHGSNELVFLMTTSLIGFSAGAVNNVAPSLKLARSFMGCALAPLLLAVEAGSFNVAFVVILLMFLAYLLLSSKQQNTEYWLLVANEYRLREQQLQLETLSRTDALTGLNNRRHFNEKLEELWRLSLRQHTSLAVLMLDIDHFKKINDTWGHSVGDACLVLISERLRSVMCRSTDVVARMGGEEFALLLPCTDSAGAMVVAEKLRQSIGATPFHYDSGSETFTIPLTVSIGIAAGSPDRYPRQTDLLSAADKALYQSKHEGRNRSSLHQPATVA